NLDTLKNQIVHYHVVGTYEYDLSRIAFRAENYLKMRVRENKRLSHPKKLALVLDIDETSLSNYNDLKALNFGGTWHQQDLAEARGDDPVIKPTLTLYRYAINHGVVVFFITGRYEKYRTGTEKNLKAAGYTQWTNLYMKPNDYKQRSAIPYKTSHRKQIADQGYDIAVNVGDQQSDLSGGYSDKVFKYPNYMYFIP
ncbi:MAG TPA: HAD family acid phosphatase, partial [Gammaproteobacteria bacterium]|nr:HAD family acid phosphatase [Gammaproteobacteria bacterium]